MPGRKFSSGEYRFGFNGMEKNPEINNGSYTTEFRQLDTRIGKWWSNDPVFHAHLSPYNSMDNNPIVGTDIAGSNTESTHLDADGNVIAVFDDGDLGIYQHNDISSSQHRDGQLATLEQSRDLLGTSGGGEQVGVTHYWYTFMNTDEINNGFTGPSVGARIDNEFPNALNDLVGIPNLNEQETGREIINTVHNEEMVWSNYWQPTAQGKLAQLALRSANSAPLDIKTVLDGNNGYRGYLFRRGPTRATDEYVTGKALGNILFGMNMRAINPSYQVPAVFWETAMPVVGGYNQMQNNTTFGTDNAFFGEHTYSGSYIFLGFFQQTAR